MYALLICDGPGGRQVERNLEYFNLDVIISVGYRVKSQRGTQFRIWANSVLKEYIIKGFAMDDERLKGNSGGNYWKELLDRIRDIRSSEKVLYRQVLDLYATSVDYNPKSEESIQFFKIVQNKLHYAAHGHTAAEVIYERANAEKPFMGLTSFSGELPALKDIGIAKNYLRVWNMRLAYEMEYIHPTNERSDIEMIPFSAEYQNEYRTIYNRCFHEMREALDIRPYDFVQDDSYFDSGMDVVYLLVEKGSLVGAVSLEDDEINDLFVDPRYQDLGYGRKILLWALENIHTERVILHVSAWNEKAVKLYRRIGFEITKTIIVGQDESGRKEYSKDLSMINEMVKTWLDERGFGDRLTEHTETIDTVEHAAMQVGCTEAEIAKTLSFIVDEKPVIIVMAGDGRVNSSKFKAQFHTKPSMIPRDKVEELTGFLPGGVCPFGVPEGIPIWLDVSMKRFDYVHPAGGNEFVSVKLTPDELEKASGAIGWCDVCKGWEE